MVYGRRKYARRTRRYRRRVRRPVAKRRGWRSKRARGRRWGRKSKYYRRKRSAVVTAQNVATQRQQYCIHKLYKYTHGPLIATAWNGLVPTQFVACLANSTLQPATDGGDSMSMVTHMKTHFLRSETLWTKITIQFVQTVLFTTPVVTGARRAQAYVGIFVNKDSAVIPTYVNDFTDLMYNSKTCHYKRVWLSCVAEEPLMRASVSFWVRPRGLYPGPVVGLAPDDFCTYWTASPTGPVFKLYFCPFIYPVMASTATGSTVVTNIDCNYSMTSYCRWDTALEPTAKDDVVQHPFA